MDNKSPMMKMFLDEVSKEAFGISRSDALAQNICVECKGSASSFRDEVSRKEYNLSALCQTCQDKVFI